MITLDAPAGNDRSFYGGWCVFNGSVTVCMLNGYYLNLAQAFRLETWTMRPFEQPDSAATGRPGKLRMAAADTRH
jgi:hypothetical protein